MLNNIDRFVNMVYQKKFIGSLFQTAIGYPTFRLANTESDQWLYPQYMDFLIDREYLYFMPKDAEGIPFHQHRQTHGMNYSPTRVAIYGLAHWNRFRYTKNNYSKNCFLKTAQWLARTDDGIWVHHYDWYTLETIKAPWLSSISQGMGISVLCRAYVLTGDSHYLDIAQHAFMSFAIDCQHGGFQSRLDTTGDVFWEEAPCEHPFHILNGYLFGVIGMIELRRLVSFPLLNEYLDIAKNTLERNIHRWDLGYWSAYSLFNENSKSPHHIASARYHSLHILQTAFIGREFHLDVLIQVSKNWSDNFNDTNCRLRTLVDQVRFRAYLLLRNYL